MTEAVVVLLVGLVIVSFLPLLYFKNEIKYSREEIRELQELDGGLLHAANDLACLLGLGEAKVGDIIAPHLLPILTKAAHEIRAFRAQLDSIEAALGDE